MRITRLLPLSGIPFVALVVLSIGIGGGTPDPAAPAAATIAVGVLTRLALANGADGGTTAEGLQALNVLDSHVVYALVASFGVMMLGAAGWLLGREGVHGWLGWIALALGVALFVPFLGVLALLLAALWIIAASVALYTAVGSPRARTEP